ncbi:hypothetical protein [Methylomagnum sp.]
MATWLAVEFTGKPNELSSFVQQCNREGKKFKIASDTKGGVIELNNIIKSAGINNFSAALIKDDDSYKALL